MYFFVVAVPPTRQRLTWSEPSSDEDAKLSALCREDAAILGEFTCVLY